MRRISDVIKRVAEDDIHNKQLRKRVQPSLSADFEYFPGRVVVLYIKKGKYTLKGKKKMLMIKIK